MKCIKCNRTDHRTCANNLWTFNKNYKPSGDNMAGDEGVRACNACHQTDHKNRESRLYPIKDSKKSNKKLSIYLHNLIVLFHFNSSV